MRTQNTMYGMRCALYNCIIHCISVYHRGHVSHSYMNVLWMNVHISFETFLFYVMQQLVNLLAFVLMLSSAHNIFHDKRKTPNAKWNERHLYIGIECNVFSIFIMMRDDDDLHLHFHFAEAIFIIISYYVAHSGSVLSWYVCHTSYFMVVMNGRLLANTWHICL